MSRRGFERNQVDQAASHCRCPVCGEMLDGSDRTFAHVRDEHPDAFAELSGLEVEIAPARDSTMDLVEWCERLTARAGRRRHW